jgi:putative ABC transport system ATP-binding protein
MIRLENVHRTFRKGTVAVRALDGVTLSVDRHEWLALIGPSGAGKSTLLYVVGLLDTPTTGTYRLDGEEVSKLTDRARSRLRNQSFGFVFQSFNLVPQYPAWRNVALPLYYAGIRWRERRATALRLLGQFGLSDRADHLPAELSGGEEQRVAIARAIANSPGVILADEPTGNLDQNTGEVVLNVLGELHQRGTGMILVTHDVRVSERSQRSVEIVDGRIVGGEVA